MLRLAGPYHRDNGTCPYLPDRQWSADYVITQGSVEVAPHDELRLTHNTFEGLAPPLAAAQALGSESADASVDLFSKLLALGFRRAGRTFYRPSCIGCAECVSLRLDVQHFTPSGDQRRALRKNPDVEVEIGMPTFTEEKFALYSTFVEQRYPGDDLSASSYQNFFLDHVGNTREFRYRVNGRLVGMGIVDVVADAISSVYFFFDPAESARSLGTYSVLREIDFCRQSARKYVYLGFRVAGCRAMRYKSNYRPHELLSPTRGWIPEEAW